MTACYCLTNRIVHLQPQRLSHYAISSLASLLSIWVLLQFWEQHRADVHTASQLWLCKHSQLPRNFYNSMLGAKVLWNCSYTFSLPAQQMTSSHLLAHPSSLQYGIFVLQQTGLPLSAEGQGEGHTCL